MTRRARDNMMHALYRELIDQAKLEEETETPFMRVHQQQSLSLPSTSQNSISFSKKRTR